MKRPQCALNCNRGCSKDFSSREPQSPSLVALDVVRKLFVQAFVNSFKRLEAVQNGEMDLEEKEEKDRVLHDWLTDTFCGRNPHFEVGPENWNPKGLSEHLRGVFSNAVEPISSKMPDDDSELIEYCFTIFLDQVQSAINSYSEHGLSITSAQEIPEPALQFIESWAMLFVGAPTEVPEGQEVY